jgi:FAD/FMN-containing dehydrogenase
MYAGDMAAGEAALAPLRAIGTPIADVIGPHPFTGWQQAFDPLLTAGQRNYWKTHDFRELSDEVIDLALEYVTTLPDAQCEVFFAQVGGAQSQVSDDATAYQGRSAAYVMNVHGRWSDPSGDDVCIAWCRDLWSAMAPHATGEAYVNFMTEDDRGRVESAYGPSYPRLVDLKDRYDPGNLFRMNQNVPPSTRI